jgi:hypothetical protein
MSHMSEVIRHRRKSCPCMCQRRCIGLMLECPLFVATYRGVFLCVDACVCGCVILGSLTDVDDDKQLIL